MLLCRAAAPIALLAAMALAGCTAPEPEPTQTVAPTDEPLFASEEEALAAAEAVYSDYQSQLDEIAANGGEGLGELVDTATPEVIDVQEPGFDMLTAESIVGTGEKLVASFEVQSIDLFAKEGSPVVSAYVCRDISQTDLIDANGRSVVEDDRVTLVALEVTFDFEPSLQRLIVSKDEVWSGPSFC